ncbi:MAG TPA: DUF881 domain-containing protein [Armatimonadota bacterium]
MSTIVGATKAQTAAAQKSLVWQITLLSGTLGVLLALSLQTQHKIQSQVGMPARWAQLAAKYRLTEDALKKSDREVAKLREQIEKLEQHPSGSSTGRVDAMRKELSDMRAFAGFVPLQGPGIEVILHDSPHAAERAERYAKLTGRPVGEVLQSLLVHDRDVVGAVNELFAAGAEAIAVNGVRLVSRASVRCQGPTVFINGKPTGGAAPYRITAIGPPKDLEMGLRLTGGFLDAENLTTYDLVTIKRLPSVSIPAYTGPTFFDYAKVVPAAKRQKVASTTGTAAP